MTHQRSVEYLTGFLMGVFLGFGLEAGLVVVYNLCIGWFGLARFQPPWWLMIPFPLLLGVGMSKTIADLHLEDY